MILCLCRGVSDRAVEAMIADGASSVAQIERACGAGGDCGACGDLPDALVERARERHDTGGIYEGARPGARMCENWGYKRLWKKLREESIGEMRHADRLIERILYLEGVPNVQRLGKVNVGQTVPEQLRLDLDLERAAVAALNAGVELCRGLGDNGTRDLVEDILTAEEGHIDWIEEQMELMRQVGEPHY